MLLLDTDTLIYVLKGNPRVVENLRLHLYDPMYISAISMMELYYGAYKSQMVDANLARLRAVENSFPILSPGPESSEIFGKMKARLETEGTRLDDLDLIIAAIALTNNLIMVTNNLRHFSRIQGLKLTNWA
jgi:tRNA(fMet)-specific endonuclease VapC